MSLDKNKFKIISPERDGNCGPSVLCIAAHGMNPDHDAKSTMRDDICRWIATNWPDYDKFGDVVTQDGVSNNLQDKDEYLTAISEVRFEFGEGGHLSLAIIHTKTGQLMCARIHANTGRSVIWTERIKSGM